MKEIYLLRHAETPYTISGKGEGPDAHLTETGIESARKAGLFLKGYNFDYILSSPFDRTKETAELISNILEVQVEYSTLLTERGPVAEYIGRAATEEDVKRYIFFEHDHEDGEAYDIFVMRAQKTVQLFDEIIDKNKKVLVVTHGLFMRILVGYILFSENLSRETAAAMIRGMRTTNCGLTKLSKGDTGKWKLETWNQEII